MKLVLVKLVEVVGYPQFINMERNSKGQLKDAITQEYIKCASDPVYFLKKYCVIQHPIKGTYDKWAEKKIIANKLAWITDQKQSIEEFKNQKAPEFMEQFRPDGYSVDRETWKMNSEGITKQADEALEHLQKLEDSLK